MSTEISAEHAGQQVAVPPIVDDQTWEPAVAELRIREKAATRELDAVAAARRRLPMVELSRLRPRREGRSGAARRQLRGLGRSTFAPGWAEYQ